MGGPGHRPGPQRGQYTDRTAGYADESELDEIVKFAQAEMYAITAIVERAVDTVGACDEGEITGVPTGFTDLDSLTKGWQPGQLIVLAGRPAMGKSTVALAFARAAAIGYGRSVAIFSLEMSEDELGMRVLSAEARVGLHHLRRWHRH